MRSRFLFRSLLSPLTARPLGMAALAALALSTTACKPDHPKCKRDKHCHQEIGEKCVDGVCQSCWSDADCAGKGKDGEDLACVENRCAEGTTPGAGGTAGGGAGAIGAPCASSGECNQGLVCIGGKCANCLADGDCGAGQTCNLNTGLCEASGECACQSDDQCAMDEVCENCACVFSGQKGSGDDPCSLSAVFFDFDSPRLNPEAQSKLQAAAQCIAQQKRAVHLEAHADPRGTVEYNILLTDKRGQSVKAFLSNLGVGSEYLNVVAKGSMEATGTDESGWSQDRRVEFVWK